MTEEKKLENELVETKDSVAKLVKHRSDDYEYAREVLYAASERLQDVLDSAVQLAQESEHPRAIEVASNTAQTLGNIAGQLMDHHIRTEKINKGASQNEKSVTNNNLNVKVNTKDLLELLGKE
jgi:predicted urease superfamily metal-dependent hydrolase